jgi:hypothetical protein
MVSLMRYLDRLSRFFGWQNSKVESLFLPLWVSRCDTNEADGHDVYKSFSVLSHLASSFHRSPLLSIGRIAPRFPRSADDCTLPPRYLAPHLHHIYYTDIKSISSEALRLGIAAVRLATNASLHPLPIRKNIVPTCDS